MSYLPLCVCVIDDKKYNLLVSGTFPSIELIFQLEFASDFDSDINDMNLELFTSLQVIDFKHYKYDISLVKIPEYVQSVILWDALGLDKINNVKWPANLWNLSFGFNGHKFDQNSFPDSIEHIYLGHDFNQNIDDIRWPRSLHTLDTGDIFNHNIRQLPKSFRVLQLGKKFNHTLDDINCPQLTHLECGYHFNQKLPAFLLNLEVIELGRNFSQDISQLLFNLLYEIYDHSCTITIKSCKFPKSLRRITHINYGIYNTIYERPSGMYTKTPIRK
jgi:hypothetical protein